MSKLAVARPGPDEADPYYQRYISAVAGEDIAAQLRDQIDQLDRLLRPLSDAEARRRYAEGKWSIKEVLGHLIDTERIFAYRMLRISRGDPTPLPGFDENAYVPAGRFDQRPLPELLGEFRAMRQSTAAMVEGTATEWWERRGVASEKPISARALAYIIVGHVTHHLGVLKDRYGLRPR